MKYRSRMDIVAAVLQVASEKGGAIKTRIMYKAFLSFPQLKDYLETLQAGKLLEYNEETKTYATTSRGKDFLKMYTTVGVMLMPKSAKAKSIDVVSK